MANVTPYLRVKDSDAAITFYKLAFGAEEQYRLTDPNGKIGHAEITIEGALIQIADEYPEYGILGPQSIGNTSVGIHLKVSDVDKVFNQAIMAGGVISSPLVDQFYGDRTGSLTDPFGHSWMVSTTIETVTPDEMQKRYLAMFESNE
jgi:PhnB protein